MSFVYCTGCLNGISSRNDIIQGYISMALGGAFEAMQEVPAVIKYLIMVLSGTGVLWYIQLLWIFSILLLLVRRVEKDRLWNICPRTNVISLLAMTVLIWGAAQILNMPVITVYRFGLYWVVFLLGYFVFSHEEVMDTLKKWFVPFLLIAVVLGTAFCTVYFGENYAAAPVNSTPLFTAYGWFACLAILGGMAKYGDFTNGFTKWMSKRSYGLYVFHYLDISSVALFLGKPGRVSAVIVYLISLIAGFVTGYLLNEVISRIPFLRWAVLGIKKERKENVYGQSGPTA